MNQKQSSLRTDQVFFAVAWPVSEGLYKSCQETPFDLDLGPA